MNGDRSARPARDEGVHPTPYVGVLPDTEVDRVLRGEPPSRGAPMESHVLAALVSTLHAPTRPEELTGEVEAVAAYVVASSTYRHRCPRARRRRAVRALKIAAAAAAATLILGSVAAAAKNGDLPTPLQKIAEVVLGVPDPEEREASGQADENPLDTVESTTHNHGVSKQTSVRSASLVGIEVGQPQPAAGDAVHDVGMDTGEPAAHPAPRDPSEQASDVPAAPAVHGDPPESADIESGEGSSPNPEAEPPQVAVAPVPPTPPHRPEHPGPPPGPPDQSTSITLPGPPDQANPPGPGQSAGPPQSTGQPEQVGAPPDAGPPPGPGGRG